MTNDIIETILDQSDDNLIHEAGRDAGEAIAKAIGRQPDVPRMTPEDFVEQVCEVIMRGHGAAANAFAAGIAAGLREGVEPLVHYE